MNKYKILEGQYIEVCGKKLYRIQALKDFNGVKSGDMVLIQLARLREKEWLDEVD